MSSILGTSPEDIDTPRSGSDRILLVIVIMLMTIGILAVYSSTAWFAQMKGTTAGNLVVEHMLKLSIAFVVMLIVSKISYRSIARYSRVLLLLSWVMLIAVIVYGDVVFGARRSLTLGGFSFQPSSVAAVALIVHVSVLMSQKQEYIKSFKRSFLPVMFWVTITCGLIGLEDFSSAALLMGVCLIIMFIGRMNTLHLSSLIVVSILGAFVLLNNSEERQSRIHEYLGQITDINSTELVPGSGYQAQQSFIAIAQGNLFGVGMGQSTQRDFLPAPYNDFIFAIITEEYGITGAIFIILLFTGILWRGFLVIARNAEDDLGAMMAAGCTLLLCLYGFINAGVASGLLPVTGLPMPFVSYGGTSTLFAGLMTGVLFNISKHNKNRKSRFYFA